MTAKIARARRAITAAETALARLDAGAEAVEITRARLAAEAALAEAGATLDGPTFADRFRRAFLVLFVTVFGFLALLFVLGSV